MVPAPNWIEREALAWVNRTRLEYGAQMLSSLPSGEEERSPVEVALGPSAHVCLGKIQVWQGTSTFYLDAPDSVWRHISIYREDHHQ